jgi:tRNA A-37 threonylcarbamoyl transferase component Bud32/tetratricopeptide (TPR) repeat protein
MNGIRLAAILFLSFSSHSFGQDEFGTITGDKKSIDASEEPVQTPCTATSCGPAPQTQIQEVIRPSDGNANIETIVPRQESAEPSTSVQKQSAQFADAAQEAASRKDWVAAIKDINAAIDLNPADSQLRQRKEALLKLAPKDIAAKFDIGNAGRQAQGLINSAQTDSLPIEPTSATLGTDLGTNVEQTSPAAHSQQEPEASRIEREWEANQLQSASRKMAIGDYAGAKTYVISVLNRYPGDWTAHRILAKVLLSQPNPDYKAAIAKAEAVLRLHHNDSEMLDVLASALTRSHKENAANEIAKYLSVIGNENNRTAEAYFILSEAHRRDGKSSEAIKNLSDAASYDPQQFQKLYDRALAAYDRQGSQTESNPRPWGKFATLIAGLAMVFGSTILLRGIRHTPTIHKTPLPFPKSRLDDKGGVVSPFVWRPGAWLITDKYQLVRLAGSGGMGEVWEASDSILGRRVAVKRWIGGDLANDNDKARFLKEARTVAKLKHPNIVAIHDVQEKPELFLVFEYVEGRTLGELLEKKKRLSFSEALRYLRPVCRALIYTHARNVIHRDLKPSNVMVQQDGLVKVMDFGIARDTKHTSTLTNTPMGTPVYMAPEMHLGLVSPACDVFSLGVMLYELLAGELPSRENFRRLTSFVPALPAGIDEFVARGLNTDPVQRIPTVEQFLAGLEKLAQAPKAVLVREAQAKPMKMPKITPSHGAT